MMNTAMGLFNDAARIGVAILLNGLWQGALIAGATAAALRVFSNANASTRYAAWCLALVAVAVVPVVTSLSRVSVDQPAAVATRYGTPSVAPQKALRGEVPAKGLVANRTTAAAPNAASVPQTQHSFNPLHFTIPAAAAAIGFGIWIAASLLVVTRLVVAFQHLERLKQDAMPLAVDRRDAMPQWQAALKGARDVRICVSRDIDVPIAVGIFDAMILLPEHLVDSLESSELDQITLHELAHLLRADDWSNGLQRLIGALLFFNPAIWFISRQLDVEREVACDDYVLELTGAVRPYAFCLTKMAEITAWPHRPLPAPGVFVTRKNISIRIERLLRTGRAIGSSIAPSAASAVVVSLLAVIFLLRMMTPSIAFSMPAVPPIPAIAPLPKTAAIVPPALPSIQQLRIGDKRPMVQTNLPQIVPGAAAIAHVKAVAAIVHAKTAALAKIHESVRPMEPIAPPGPAGRVASLDTMQANDREGCGGCNFASAQLAGHDFRHQNLEGANFDGTNLQGAHFDHAVLTGTNFNNADLRNASFAGAQLEGCNLRGARLDGVRFEGAQLTGCNIDTSRLSPEQAKIVLTSCLGCNFANANLRGMDLRNVHLEGANLAHADLRGANLQNAQFTGVNLSGASLNGAHLEGASFMGCEFNGVDLRNVDLNHTQITGSSLRGAIMRD